jgi:hypothetical protein
MSGEMDCMSWKEKGDCMNILESLDQAFIDRTEIWEQLAKEIGAQFNRDRLRHQGVGIGRVVCLVMEEWFISLEEYRATHDFPENVRMRAPYQDKNGFRFAISRKDMFSEIGKLFGMQDVKIGDAVFDDEFIIKSNDEEKVRAFFDSPRLRQLAQAQPYVSFEIREGERPGIETVFGASNVELYTSAPYDKDVAILKSTFEMFGEALRQLRRIGSA